jgi:hypothetical protein
MACINSSFGQSMEALPSGNQPGLSIVCNTPANALQRFVSGGIQGGITGNDTTNTTGSTGTNDPNDDGESDDNTGVGNPATNTTRAMRSSPAPPYEMPPQLPCVPLISNTLHFIVATHPFLVPSLSYHAPLFAILYCLLTVLSL